ncbi:MAG: long-chain fatty acid--CoA ligase [Parvibaculaceae bacterium]
MSEEKPFSGRDHPWVSAYPPSVRWDAELEISSLPAMLDASVRAYGNRTCTDFLGATLTYAEIGGMVDRLAAGLAAAGFGKGDRIGLFLPNSPTYIVAYFAALKAGATVVNFNPLYTEEEITHQAKDAGVRAMVTLDLAQLYGKVAALARNGVIERVICCPFTDNLPTLKRWLFRIFKSKEIADTRGPQGKVLHWRDLTAPGRSLPAVAIDPEKDVALLQYTGGTTGTPKGAMLTHANLTANVSQNLAWAPVLERGGERIMGILPFFHVFAMTAIMNMGLKLGATLILLPRFDLKQAVAEIKRTRPTILPGVPTLYTALLNFPGIRKEDLASLKFSVSGGAPLPLEVRRRFEAFTGGVLVEGYGLSETSPVATCNPLHDTTHENSIGQPLPRTIVQIRSTEDPKVEMPLGEAGEVCIKGPQVMPGYWNKPEENAASFVDGFFRTGDVGYMDREGFIYLIDRIKDIINCSGFKVYPRRIEEALYAHPAVAETTVVGIPDAYRGEAPKAFVKLKPGMAATAEELLEHLKKKISKIGMPSEIEFRDELPHTMVGKLSKKELRKEEAAKA